MKKSFVKFLAVLLTAVAVVTAAGFHIPAAAWDSVIPPSLPSVTVSKTSVTTLERVVVSWSAQRADRYQIMLDGNIQNYDSTANQLTTRISYSYNNLSVGTHSVKVKAFSLSGASAWSAEKTFQIVNGFTLPLTSAYATNKVTWAFGGYWAGGYHLAVDYGTSGNSASSVKAITDGKVYKVIKAADSGSRGNMVVVKHIVNGKTFYSAYEHLKDNSIVVSAGQSLRAGTVIGVMGSTGNSTAPHLHLAVYQTSDSSKICVPLGVTATYFTGNIVTRGSITYYNAAVVISGKAAIIR